MKIFNSMTNRKETFVPMDEDNVRIYSCGPTVYNYFHIGNARPFITFDCLRRYMEYKGWKVTFVQNFTDIDDRMINRANEEGISVKELADRFIAEYFVDARGLGIREASVHPRATENIDEIIDIVRTLEEKGYAYESHGDVYYRARKFEGYGKLSHQPIDDLESGARISQSEIKEDPLDFALWKAAKPGEPSWDSPWGKGRPGWHIECSAMARKYLGETIDIHCGGKDLIFPHHENEIAQSEACNCKEFARYWMHNGFISVDNEKMSKSLGNFFTVRDVAEQYGYETIRFFMLSAHYRKPLNYSTEILEQAKTGLERIYECKRNLAFRGKSAPAGGQPDLEKLTEAFDARRSEFCDAMEDDLNTADAIAAIFNLVRDINAACSGSAQPSAELIRAASEVLDELTGVLGIAQKKEESLDEKVEGMIEERQAARKEKDFAKADRIRDELKAMGIILEDTPQGVRWHRES